MSITIIIPTYERLDYLKLALQSCLQQSLLPEAIIIGDDSKDDQTETWYNAEKKSWPIPVIYQHNKPGLGQAGNVQKLIQSVETTHLLLLHDDDLLMPNALEDLWAVQNRNPDVDVVFGKQILIDEHGRSNMQESEKMNRTFYRTKAYEGRIEPSKAVVIRQQLPSNSFLINTELAKNVGYGEPEVAGNGVDFHFCYKLSIRGVTYFYIDRYISYYRDSPDGISKTSDSGFRAFKLIAEMKAVKPEVKQLKNKFLRTKAPVAIGSAVNNGYKKEAFKIYFSKYHYKKILLPSGLYRLYKILRA